MNESSVDKDGLLQMLLLSCPCAAITVQPARQEANCKYVSGSISPTDKLLCCYVPKALVCVEFEDFSDNGCRKHTLWNGC